MLVAEIEMNLRWKWARCLYKSHRHNMWLLYFFSVHKWNKCVFLVPRRGIHFERRTSDHSQTVHSYYVTWILSKTVDFVCAQKFGASSHTIYFHHFSHRTELLNVINECNIFWNLSRMRWPFWQLILDATIAAENIFMWSNPSKSGGALACKRVVCVRCFASLRFEIFFNFNMLKPKLVEVWSFALLVISSDWIEW